MPQISDELRNRAVNTIKLLAVDAVEKAKSGHPGMPMGTADIAFVLWTQFLQYNPEDPNWLNRDRFVLSAGHGSMLLYSMLHLSGYKISMDDLKNFRQLHSITPGHPEYGCTPGVETTTGPLGQGFANGAGMALAGKILRERFNALAGKEFFDYRVYAIVSDGDLMEGITSEAASLAGHLGLNNMVYLYDDNHITIEGDTALSFSEDVAKRFEAYNWHVQRVDGHNHQAIANAIEKAQAEKDRPNLILARTHIAKGSPHKQDSQEAHGSPLGEEEARATRKNLGCGETTVFCASQEIYDIFKARKEENLKHYTKWQAEFAALRAQNKEFSELYAKMFEKQVPENIFEILKSSVKEGDQATRVSSGNALQKLSPAMPSLIGGSADLAPSNNTSIKEAVSIKKGNFAGRNLHFGIREHCMGAVMNGMALNGGFIPYGGTFLIFSDYMRPSIRLAALMNLRVIYVFTHDSIFLGEDGPSHQPIEHLAALRAIPNMTVIRPADGMETALAWEMALKNTTGPTALILTRQNLPLLDRKKYTPAEGIRKGGYVVSNAKNAVPDAILIASGSEVPLALETQNLLLTKGIDASVVNMACWNVFEKQAEEYRKSVLPDACKKRVSIEAAGTFGWEKWVGCEGLKIGIDRYGESAPIKALAKKFGFTPEAVVDKIMNYTGK
ncbi:MAG: transketolase [Planctomycetes bacterium]|nr:transketolase [Planctomycetota bacterium]